MQESAYLSTERSTWVFSIVNAVTTLSVMTFLVWLVYFNQGTPHHSAANSSVLPAVNAALNGLSAALIAAALAAIKMRRYRLHAGLMIAGTVVSACFLGSYIYYHMHHAETRYLGTGWIRPVYFTILISHIVLSVVAFPMILTSLFLAISRRWKAHRRVSPYTWGTWMYVSVTGIVVYVMLHGF
jgi:putative membrane protein